MTNFGTIAEFKNSTELYNTAKAIKNLGYKNIEAYSPFPIHGMDDACGIKASKMPWFSLIGGVLGLIIGIGLQVWASTDGYRMIISAKPDGFDTIIAFMPVIFELTILIASFFTVFGMLKLNKLGEEYNHPLFEYEPFKKVTDDGFFFAILKSDQKYKSEESESILKKLGGGNVETL